MDYGAIPGHSWEWQLIVYTYLQDFFQEYIPKRYAENQKYLSVSAKYRSVVSEKRSA